jgi:hypothetical protein
MKRFRKFDNGKPRMSLVPPDALIGLAHVLTHGAKKYSAHNWAKGAHWSRYLDAAGRHSAAFTAGEDIDPDSGLPHIDCLFACVAFLSAYQKRRIGKDDRFRIRNKRKR